MYSPALLLILKNFNGCDLAVVGGGGGGGAEAAETDPSTYY